MISSKWVALANAQFLETGFMEIMPIVLVTSGISGLICAMQT